MAIAFILVMGFAQEIAQQLGAWDRTTPYAEHQAHLRNLTYDPIGETGTTSQQGIYIAPEYGDRMSATDIIWNGFLNTFLVTEWTIPVQEEESLIIKYLAQSILWLRSILAGLVFFELFLIFWNKKAT